MSAPLAHRYVQLARHLVLPIRKLDSLLVPLADGWRDSHGVAVSNPAEVRERLMRSLEEAGVAIEAAKQWLITDKERTPDAVQPGN